MTIPAQPQTPSEEILLRVSNNPDVALNQVILEELNRMNTEIMRLKGEVASLKSQISNLR